MIFSSTIYTEHKFKKDYQFWLPLIALYSGARLEELCQLHLRDIQLETTPPYIDINDNFDGQHIKNNSSRRKIPIHPELIAVGFDNFVSQKKLCGEKMLFGYLAPQRQQLGHKPSQWFSKYKTRLGINNNKKVFHSFRHTMVDHPKKARARDYEIKSLLGHKNGSITHDIYGSIDPPIDTVSKMLNELSFKKLTSQIKKWS
ncbi:site-specific integrase [Thalassotalea marina]|uniref:Tyr recombinase domain-containing protein n=1 Tax=Thalassotalea marina TaxID=1673741 RepID=A0A919ELZ5_9GAMM|nr:site-specific integrase [Thalassotalea marina]GHF98298.1 hypothetical protein GCM10017161_28440 [Thalassotalea marina]